MNVNENYQYISFAPFLFHDNASLRGETFSAELVKKSVDTAIKADETWPCLHVICTLPLE